MIGTAIFRADTGPHRGIGHFIRCLSLASSWVEKGGKAHIVGKFNDSLAKRARKLNVIPIKYDKKQGSTRDLIELKNICNTFNGVWTCLDGYDFGPDFVSSLRSPKSRVLQFADGPIWKAYCPDILVDQNLRSETLKYPTQDKTRVLLGPSYVCIDSSFKKQSIEILPLRNSVKHVLVTMGGSDQKNRTKLVLESIMNIKEFNEITVVTGPNFKHFKSLDDLKTVDSRVSLINNSSNMRLLFENSDMIISSAGITSYEISIVGRPMILIAIVKNQIRNANAFQAEGMSYSISTDDLVTRNNITELVKNLACNKLKRSSMVRFMRNKLDVHGADRVVINMLEYKDNDK